MRVFENIRNLSLFNMQSVNLCNAPMTQVYNSIKGKTIDESKLKVVDVGHEPSVGSVSWYLVKAGGEILVDTVAFLDRRDTNYDYAIVISTHEEGGCCSSNPVKDCVCGENLCILTIQVARGKGATATATISGGVVTGVTITSGGSGYTLPPDIFFDSGDATATATVTGGVLTGITVTSGGSGYIDAPGVIILPVSSFDVPSSVIDYAIKTIPFKSNALKTVGIVFGGLVFAGAVYWLIKNRQ